LQNYDDQYLTLDHLVEIRKQWALEEAEEPEPEQKTMAVSEFTEGLWGGPNQVGMKVFEDTDSNEQQPVTTN
jgi:hypothetical protein